MKTPCSLRWLFFVGLFLFLSALSAQADIILMDFTGSWPEIQAAKEMAKQRGEKLILLPDMPDKVAEQYFNLKKQLVANEHGYPLLKDKYNKLRDAKEAIENRYQMKGPRGLLKKTITTLSAKGRKVSSLIIQGHASGREFFGDLDRGMGLSREDILAAFNGNPKSKATLDSVYLWGCYTATAEGAMWWKKNFPGLKIMAGFSGTAPSSMREASPALLKKMLTLESKATEKMCVQDAIRLTGNLGGKLQTTFAGSVGQCYMSKDAPPVNLGKLNAKCKNAAQELQAGNRAFYQYYDAFEKAHFNPPADTHHSVLRNFYNKLQEYYFCKPYLEHWEYPRREQVLVLIFFENIKKVFVKNFQAQIDSANKELKVQKAPRQAPQIPDLSKLSRREMILFAEKLRFFLNSPGNTANSLKGTRALLSAISNYIIGCNAPVSWVTME